HRDQTCRFPGCGRKKWLKAHHLVHWARGGGTDLAISCCCATPITGSSTRGGGRRAAIPRETFGSTIRRGGRCERLRRSATRRFSRQWRADAGPRLECWLGGPGDEEGSHRDERASAAQ